MYTCGLDISQTETKGTVLLKKADELLNFTQGEEKQLEGVGLSRLGEGLLVLTSSTLKRLPTLESSSLSPDQVSETSLYIT